MVVLVFVCVCAVAPRQCTSQFEIVVHVRVSGGIRGAPGRTGQLGPKRVLERTITGPNRRQFPISQRISTQVIDSSTGSPERI